MIYKFTNYLQKSRPAMICYDIISIVLASILPVLLRFGSSETPVNYFIPITKFLGINLILTILTFFLFRMYSGNTEHKNTKNTWIIILPVIISTALNGIGINIINQTDQPIFWSYYLYYALLLLVFVVIGRYSQVSENQVSLDENHKIKKMAELFSYENVVSSIRSSISKSDKLAFISSFICCLFGYLYFAVHLMPNHDGIVRLYWHDWNDFATFGSGRWMQTFFSSISPLYTPWVLCLTAFIMASISTVIVVRLFSIKRSLSIIGISVCLILNPFVVSVMTYTYMIDGHFIGLLLCVIAAYIVDRGKWGGMFIGMILLTFAMGQYQIFLFVTVAILTVRILQRLLQGSETNKEILSSISRYLIFAFGSLSLYMIINQLVLNFIEMDITQYQGLNEMTSFSINQILTGFRLAYQSIFELISLTFVVGGLLAAISSFLLLILIPVSGMILLYINKTRPLFQTAFAAFLIITLPIFIGSFFFAGIAWVHNIVRFPQCAFFICGIVLADGLENERQKDFSFKRLKHLCLSLCFWVILGCTLLSGFRWGVVANEAGLVLEMQHKNIQSLMIRVADRIEQYPEFDVATTPVAIYGHITPFNSSYAETKPYFRRFGRLTGIYIYDYLIAGFFPDYSYFLYMKDWIGLNFIAADDEMLQVVFESDEFQNMPYFPAKDSLMMIEGVLVVNLAH